MKNTSNASQMLTSSKAEPITNSPDEISNGAGTAIIVTDAFDTCPVVNAQAIYLGEVAHLMAIVPDGQIAYVVVSSGGVLGVGNKLHAIPWNALVFDADNECFVLNTTEETLEKAPTFEKDNWPVMTDTAWSIQIHDYYGQSNYWHPPNSAQVQVS